VDAVPPGEALGRLNLHRDIPNRYDAWDIDASYREWRADATSTGRASVTSRNGITKVRSQWSVGGFSTAVLTWSIADAAPGLGLTVEVDWRERQHLLKLALPIDVLARDAVSEIQFGHLARPLHQNTSWDAARFETCAQRWVHVGESGFGVAVANASTYGWDITRNPRPDGGTTTLVRATLLRAPIIPDPHCDEGEHTFEFEIVPGADISAAVSSGYRLNLPMVSLRGDGPVEPLVAVDHPAVIVEAVKLAEDGSGDVVVRLFESLGGKAAALLTTSFQPVHASWTDLLERPLGKPVGLGPEGVSLSLRPFEIVTLRLGRPTS
jgi:alpha-mannosidase